MRSSPTRKFLALCVGTLLTGGVSQTHAARPTFTQEFNVESAPCEGLALDGVGYSFSVGDVPDLGCTVGQAGPTTDNVQPPLIQFGRGGVLRLRFAVPTTTFGFGIAQLADRPELDSVIVDLFSPGVGVLRERLTLDNDVDPDFIGGRFEYEGPAVRTATIRIAGQADGRPVALDNVTYARPGGRSRR